MGEARLLALPVALLSRVAVGPGSRQSSGVSGFFTDDYVFSVPAST
jgi:hypothetical protein